MAIRLHPGSAKKPSEALRKDRLASPRQTAAARLPIRQLPLEPIRIARIGSSTPEHVGADPADEESQRVPAKNPSCPEAKNAVAGRSYTGIGVRTGQAPDVLARRANEVPLAAAHARVGPAPCELLVRLPRKVATRLALGNPQAPRRGRFTELGLERNRPIPSVAVRDQTRKRRPKQPPKERRLLQRRLVADAVDICVQCSLATDPIAGLDVQVAPKAAREADPVSIRSAGVPAEPPRLVAVRAGKLLLVIQLLGLLPYPRP